MKKILIVSSVFGFIGSFEKNDIILLENNGYMVHTAANMNAYLGKFGDVGQLDNLDVVKHNINFSRTPLKKDNITAYFQLKKLIDKEHFDLIHCHTPIGGVVSRLVYKKLRKNNHIKLMYTAHGFHFYKGVPFINWLIYYPIEKFLSRYTDVLITINKEDYQLAKSKFYAKRVEYIPGVGIDTKKIFSVNVDVEQKRKELELNNDDFVLVSVGELNKNKNQEVVIRAISKLDIHNLKYIICGVGSNKDYLLDLIEELGLRDNVRLIGYRSDIIEICKISDVFVHPSYREGLPVSLMEAMACELPIICSNIRGNVDLIEDKKGGFIVPPNNIDDFASKIKILYQDIGLRRSMGLVNKENIKEFDISIVSNRMKQIYTNQCEQEYCNMKE